MPHGTAQSLLHGAVYSLKQCGLLLCEARLLYKADSYATALALAACAREEFGRWRTLLELRKRALAGESFTVKDVKDASDDHVSKQEAGMPSLSLRGETSSGIGKLLHTRMNAPLDSEERKDADEQIDKIDQLKWKRTPHDRHRLRMTALYVDIISEERWNEPAQEVSQTAAYEFLVDAINDYDRERCQRYASLLLVKSCDPELHDALAHWPDRPELPLVEHPPYPPTA